MTEILRPASKSQPEDARASLRRIARRCVQLERQLAEVGKLATVLEHELCGLGIEVGKLNTALAPHRQAGGGA